MSRKQSLRKGSASIQGDMIQHKQSLVSLSVAESIRKLVDETEKHDRYHRRSAKIQYVFVFIMGVLYLIYGINRFVHSTKHHQVNTFITNTDESYPVPITMVCQDASANNNSNISSQSYVNITQLVIDQYPITINPNFLNQKIVFVNNPNEILNLSHWNVLDFNRNKTFPYIYKKGNLTFNVTILFQCQVLLPPKDDEFKFGYLQNYIYHKPGLGDIDPTLYSFNENINIPEYMSKQFRYKIIHRIFHFDALYNSIKNRYPSATESTLTLSQVMCI